MSIIDDLLGDFAEGEPSSGEHNLQLALRLAKQGFPVFPCREKEEWGTDKDGDAVLFKEKSPRVKGGFKSASTEIAKIKNWWRNHPNSLVGMPTGSLSGKAVLDLDTHQADKDGIKAIKKMGLDPKTMTTLVVKTGNGGLHLYFDWRKGISNSDRHLPPGVDVRAEGGYVIAPGTRYPDGRRYGDGDLSIKTPPFPEALMAPAREDGGNGGSTKPRLGLTIAQIEQYAKEYPNSIEKGRAEWVGDAASFHHEATAPDVDGKFRPKEEQKRICEIFVEWTASVPEYSSESHRRQAAKDFWSFRDNPSKDSRTFGSIASAVREARYELDSEDDFEDYGDDLDDEETPFVEQLVGSVDDKPKKKMGKSQLRLAKEETEYALGAEAPKWVRDFNKKHALAVIAGKTMVLHFGPEGELDYGSVTDLHTFYENVRKPKDDTTVPVSKLWLQSKHRLTYPRGVIFYPNKETPGKYNQWQGFSVEPSERPDPEKGCKMFLRHLKEVVCNGDDALYQYHIRWFAHMIQMPEDKPGVAVVYRGKKRIGKDTVFEYFGELFKPHYITVANQDQMIGKFNQHQAKCLLLHMQEGFWAGNKQAEGALKYLVSSTNVMIEPKGINAFMIPSVLRLFISSNERWVVPASTDEARFFVLNVSEARRNDHAYFAKIREEMQGDGPSCLLAYLLNFDLTGFQVRAVPDTEALGEQKTEGLKNVENWWYLMIQQGYIEDVSTNEWENGSIRVDKGAFRDSYVRWMSRKHYHGDELGEVEFSKRMKAMLPDIKVVRPRDSTGGRPRSYQLPRLKACREAFEGFIGSPVSWPEDEITDYVDEEKDDLE